jgi:hypothetical protein
MNSRLCASPEAIRAHRKASIFADYVRTTAEERQGSYEGRFAATALTSIQVDAQAIHGAVLSLCDGGWAFAAPVLLRTSFELLLSALVIARGEGDREYLGLRYTHAYLKAALREAQVGDSLRNDAREQLESAIGRLPVEVQMKVRQWAFKEPLEKFWYQPEFKGPSDVIKAYGNDAVRDQYQALCGPAHGGVLGLRVFRSEPDKVHPAPRCDPSPQSSALVLSSWFLTQITRCVAHLHNLLTDDVAAKLFAEHRLILKAIDSLPDR